MGINVFINFTGCIELFSLICLWDNVKLSAWFSALKCSTLHTPLLTNVSDMSQSPSSLEPFKGNVLAAVNHSGESWPGSPHSVHTRHSQTATADIRHCSSNYKVNAYWQTLPRECRQTARDRQPTKLYCIWSLPFRLVKQKTFFPYFIDLLDWLISHMFDDQRIIN